MKQMKHKARILLVLALALVLACAFSSLAFAEGESAAAPADMNSGLGYLAAALSVGIAGIGAGIAVGAGAAIREVIGSGAAINSTKSLTGHMIGAAGAVEAIFTTLMIEHSFLCKSANLEEPDDSFAWADLISETRENVEIRHALSNSFGFGGSNASIVISKY